MVDLQDIFQKKIKCVINGDKLQKLEINGFYKF
jgi:hypothetical protein